MDFPFVKEAISQLFSKPSTAMYPAVPSIAAPNYRGRIVFHPEKCINCMMCERVCSGNAITHSVEKTEEGDLVTRTFYLGSCTFCATCKDFCGHGAIEFTDDYHMIATKEEDLLVSGTFLKKPPVKKAVPPKPAAPAPKAEEKPAAPAPKAEEKPAAPASKAEEKPAAPAPKAEEKPAAPAPKAEEKPAAPASKAEEKPAALAIQPRDDGKPVQDPSKCVYCTICARKCPAGALEVDRANKTWTLDEDVCVGCGTCAEVCPKKCIII